MNLVFFRSVLWQIILSWACCCPVSLGLYILFELFFFFVFMGLEQLSLKPGIAYFTITIWMNLIWFSFLILFCSSNKMYSFEMEILCTQPKQRWNKFLLIHIIFVGWKKWFNIFQRHNDESIRSKRVRCGYFKWSFRKIISIATGVGLLVCFLFLPSNSEMSREKIST